MHNENTFTVNNTSKNVAEERSLSSYRTKILYILDRVGNFCLSTCHQIPFKAAYYELLHFMVKAHAILHTQSTHSRKAPPPPLKPLPSSKVEKLGSLFSGYTVPTSYFWLTP